MIPFNVSSPSSSSLMRRSLAVCLLALVLGVAGVARGVPLIQSSPDDWQFSEKTNELVFVGKEGQKSAKFTMPKAELAGKLIELRIEADAKEVEISSGTASFTVPLFKGGATSVKFDMRTTPSKILVNNVEQPAIRGKWIRVTTSDRPHIAFGFEDMTYVTVKVVVLEQPAVKPAAVPSVTGGESTTRVPGQIFQVDGQPATGAPSTAAPGGAPAAVQPQAAPTIQESLQMMKKSVFRVQARDDNQRELSQGTGFLVGGNGLCLTNFHVIHGATSGVARFDGEYMDRALELVDVSPELDLALLRVKEMPRVGSNVVSTTSWRVRRSAYSPQYPQQAVAAAPKPEPEAKPLGFAKAPPKEGDDVYAVGYPLGLGFSINKGVVNGIRTLSDIPSELSSGLSKYTKTSKWVQTDCTLNHGNSGGPLVDKEGHVVGINTWGLATGNNVYFSLSAEQADDFVKKQRVADLTFAASLLKYGKYDARLGIIGRNVLPHRDIAKTGSISLAVDTSKLLLNDAVKVCPTCHGKKYGQKNTDITTRSYDGRTYTSTISSAVMCPTCQAKGSVLGPEKRICELLDRVVAACSRAKVDDKSQTKLEDLMTNLSKFSAVDFDVRAILTNHARAILAQDKIYDKPTPVTGAGWVLMVLKDPKTGAGTYFIGLDGTNKIVILDGPILADPASVPSTNGGGKMCVFGGTCAGKFTNESALSPFMVLQDGFIVSAPTTNRWGGYYRFGY